MKTKYKPHFKKDNYNLYYCNGKGLPDYPDYIPLPEVNIYLHDSGMVTTHNFPCPVCKTEHAIVNIMVGVFSPCWKCQEEGYELIKKDVNKKSFWKRVFSF